MDVKGTAFLARKVMLIEEIGEERCTQFLSEFARKEPTFDQPISATTLIPLPAFIALNEEIIATFYGSDPLSYLRFGEKSAEYALTIGPYKRIRETNSIQAFVEGARHIYQNYYTAGRAEGSMHDNVADLKVHGVPSEHRHIYLEYVSCAYFRRGIEILSCHSVTMTRILGYTSGDEEIHYRYAIEDAAAPPVSVPRRKWA
jgi:hypothetical protein